VLFRSPEQVTRSSVEAALAFVCEIQSLRGVPEARLLDDASEACFSIDAHLSTVRSRIERLHAIEPVTLIHNDVRDWVEAELQPCWRMISQSFNERLSDRRIDSKAVLSNEYRCLSPSDFGFHNALVRQGEWVFLDFEYAGWDDPAKLVCDFFCQPGWPVPLAEFDGFASGLIRAVFGQNVTEDRIHEQVQRVHFLLPVYRIKWCCILLNEFLPVGHDRRVHATQSSLTQEHLQAQFDKAIRILKVVKSECG